MRILILFLFLVPLVSAEYIGNDPLDCNPSNEEIFFGQVEICNDGIDNNCNGDYTILFDNDPNTGIDRNDIECAKDIGEEKTNFITSNNILEYEVNVFSSLGKVINSLFNVFLIK
jgi:hypothetical protein